MLQYVGDDYRSIRLRPRSARNLPSFRAPEQQPLRTLLHGFGADN
jgi:hypothetical protein